MVRERNLKGKKKKTKRVVVAPS